MRKLLLVCLATIGLVGLSQAGVVIAISDDGVDTTMTATGTLNLTGATFTGPGGFANNASWAPGFFLGETVGWGNALVGDGYAGSWSGVNPFGPANLLGFSTETTTIDFMIVGTEIFFEAGTPVGPVLGINNTATQFGATLASIGITPNQSLTFTITGATDGLITVKSMPAGPVVPEPSTYALFGLMLVGGFAWRRRQMRA